MCDLEYVNLGTADAFGVDLEMPFVLVHNANMTKASGPIDAYGKRLKPPGFEPPDEKIRALLVASGWRP